MRKALDGWAARLPERIAEVAALAVDAYDAGQDAQRVIDRHRFAGAGALADAAARLAEIEIALESSVQERWRRKRSG